MTVYVDADACPVKKQIVEAAKKRRLAVIMVTDVNHRIEDGYSRVITVDQGRDSADVKLANLIGAGDIVVTQDYGVAAMALGRGAKALNQDGLIFTSANMDQLLFERHIGQRARSAGRRTKGPSKRGARQDLLFTQALEELLEAADDSNR
ncbi:YaiI/YqxD family protein [Acidaminobacterium chupaoyuni]